MLRVVGSGIKKKQAIKITEHNNFEIYYIKSWGEDGLKFIKYDNHLFPVGFNLERIKQHLEFITDIKQALINQFEYTLKRGEGVSTGLGQYLNRSDEVIKYKEEQEKIRLEEVKQDKIKEEERKQQEAEEIEKTLIEQAEKFKEGKSINNQHFIMLCDKYNIKLPIKTRGWCLKTLANISKERYQYRQGGNKSTVIYEYTDKLFEAISK